MKIVLVSSVIPENSIGGRLVIYNHFKNLSDVELLVVSDGPVNGFAHVVLKHRLVSRLLRRLNKTFLRRWSTDIQELLLPCSPSRVSRICQDFEPDLIVTVAYGELWRMAVKQANASQVPLVTFFQDWWPDLCGAHSWLIPRLDSMFRQLHESSALSLCVCEGMAQALGMDSRVQVLAPLCRPIEGHGGGALSKSGQGDVDSAPEKPLRFLYTGNLGEYGPMIQEVLVATKDHPLIRFEAIGGNPAWPEEFRDEMQDLGLWYDFMPDQDLHARLSEADVLLAAMRFEPEMCRFMETSFPSKIIHYIQFSKPIVIWGPEYCSAVRWGRSTGGALCVTEPDPKVLLEALESLRSNSVREQLVERAATSAREEFHPVNIQERFAEMIKGFSKA